MANQKWWAGLQTTMNRINAIPSLMYTGKGLDNKVQSKRPTGLYTGPDGSTPEVYHENELVSSNGSVVPSKETSMLTKPITARTAADQEKIKKIQEKYGIKGYYTGRETLDRIQGNNFANGVMDQQKGQAYADQVKGQAYADSLVAQNTQRPNAGSMFTAQEAFRNATGQTVSPTSGRNGMINAPATGTGATGGVPTIRGVNPAAFTQDTPPTPPPTDQAGALLQGLTQLSAYKPLIDNAINRTGPTYAAQRQLARQDAAQSPYLSQGAAAAGMAGLTRDQLAAQSTMTSDLYGKAMESTIGATKDYANYIKDKLVKDVETAWGDFYKIIAAGGEENITNAAKTLFEKTGIQIDPKRYIGMDKAGMAKTIIDSITPEMIESNPEIYGPMYAQAWATYSGEYGMSFTDPSWSTDYDSITDWNSDDANAANEYLGKPKGTRLTQEEYSAYRLAKSFEPAPDGTLTNENVATISRLFTSPEFKNYFTDGNGAIDIGTMAISNPELGGAYSRVMSYFDNDTTNDADLKPTDVDDIANLMAMLYADSGPDMDRTGMLTKPSTVALAAKYGYTIKNTKLPNQFDAITVNDYEVGTSTVPTVNAASVTSSGPQQAPSVFQSATGIVNPVTRDNITNIGSVPTFNGVSLEQTEDAAKAAVVNTVAFITGNIPLGFVASNSMTKGIIGTIAANIKAGKATKQDTNLYGLLNETNWPQTDASGNKIDYAKAWNTPVDNSTLNSPLVQWKKYSVGGAWELTDAAKEFSANNKGKVFNINGQPLMLLGAVNTEGANTAGYLAFINKDGNIVKLNNAGGNAEDGITSHFAPSLLGERVSGIAPINWDQNSTILYTQNPKNVVTTPTLKKYKEVSTFAVNNIGKVIKDKTGTGWIINGYTWGAEGRGGPTAAEISVYNPTTRATVTYKLITGIHDLKVSKISYPDGVVNANETIKVGDAFNF